MKRRKSENSCFFYDGMMGDSGGVACVAPSNAPRNKSGFSNKNGALDKAPF